MTTGLYRCAGCGKKIKAPEGLCASCFKELQELVSGERKARKKRRKKK